MKFFRARKDFDVTICFTCRVCLNTQVQITKSGHRNEFASRSWHLMSGSGFVRNCKLQQVQMFGRSKNLLILQSCSWNMIVAPCQMCWIPPQKWSITSNLKALTLACLKNSARHYFDTRVFLFQASVRWLSEGNILNRVFVLKVEIKLFSELKANELSSYISDKIWLKKSCLFGWNHAAWRLVCKHFIRSCKTDFAN